MSLHLWRFVPLVLSLACALPVAVAADASGGISGYVLDELTHKPIPGVAVFIARQPGSVDRSDSVLSNKQGFFSNLGLEPGRYQVTANVAGRRATCLIEDIPGGMVRSVRILVSRAPGERTCGATRPAQSTVDPDQTASLYRVR